MVRSSQVTLLEAYIPRQSRLLYANYVAVFEDHTILLEEKVSQLASQDEYKVCISIYFNYLSLSYTRFDV